MIYKYKTRVILALLIIIGLFLRFYHFPDLFYYTMDEEVMNLIQRRIILGLHFPLIGSVSAIGTYLGPIFYYFGALILFLSKLNPLGQGMFASLVGGLNILLLYKVVKELFNKNAGIIASILYTFSFLMVIFDRRFWHLFPGPVLSLIVLWSIYKIKKGSIKFIYLLMFALIFGWNTDYTNLILFVFTAISWVVFKLPVWKKEVLIAVFIFIVSNIPLLLFDLRHDFLNTKAILNYPSLKKLESAKSPLQRDREPLIVTAEDKIQTALLPLFSFSRLVYTSSEPNIPLQHTYCKPYIIERNRAQGIVLPLLSFLIILTFFYLAFRSDKNHMVGFKLVTIFYLIFQTSLLSYGFFLKGDFFEHYLATLFPYFFIISAVVLSYFYNRGLRIVVAGFLLIFIFANTGLIFKSYNPLGFQNKMNGAEFALKSIGAGDFSLESLSSCFRWDGFYYPFVYLGKHPVKSYQDPNYSWLYDYQVSDTHPERIVVMVPKGKYEDKKFENIYNRYQKWVIERKNFGDLEVLILDNSERDFK